MVVIFWIGNWLGEGRLGWQENWGSHLTELLSDSLGLGGSSGGGRAAGK